VDPLRSIAILPLLYKKSCGNSHMEALSTILELSLCVGMPVMIKCNEATECCVTNGAEATVIGWKAHYIHMTSLAFRCSVCENYQPTNYSAAGGFA